MKRNNRFRWILLAALAGAIAARAANVVEDFIREQDYERISATRAKKPELDPKRIINESNSFLKEREPEMTAEEYALYEKIVTLLGTKPEFALKLLGAMMSEKEPPSPAFQFILGNAYYAAGQNEQAEENYRAAVTRFPTFLRAWNNLGVLYYSTDRFAEAIPCFSKSVVLGDRDPLTFGLLGFSLEKQGNVVSAEMAYMQALAGDPGKIDWKEGLLRIYVQGRQFGRAESLVRSLIKERPAEPRYWLVYANVLLSEGRKVEAIALLETSAQTGVAGPDELVLLGDLYAEKNLMPEAIAAYRQALKQSSDLGEKRLLRVAQVLIAAGRLPEADTLIAGMDDKLSPDGTLARMQVRADLHAARREWPEARRQLEALLEVAPMNGPALLGLGRAYAAEGDVAHATFEFETAWRIPGATYAASLELANIEIKRRHYADGVKYLEKALSIEKTDAVEDYLARVKTLVNKEG